MSDTSAGLAHSADVSRRTAILALVAIFLIALFLRWWGAAFGLPFNYQVSEQMYVNAAASVDQGGIAKLHPLFGPYQLLLLGTDHLLRRAEPPVSSAELTATWSGLARYHLSGRLLNGLLGAIAVFPVYLLACRLWNRRTGLVAALFLATCFMHVQNSHYAKTDIAAFLFTAIAAAAASRFGPSAGWRPYVCSGLAAGLAISAKLLAWPWGLTLAAVEFAASGGEDAGFGRRLRRVLNLRLSVAYLSMVVAFVVTTPATVLRPGDTLKFWKWVSAAGEGGGMDRFLTHGDQAIWEVYFAALRWGFGDLLLLAAVAGLAWSLVGWRRSRTWLALLTFPVIAAAFLLLPDSLAHSRYVLMPGLFLLVAAAAAVVAAADRLRLPFAGRAAVLTVATFLVAAQPLVASVRHDRLLAGKDTRTLAKDWIEAEIPEGTRIALEMWPYCPQIGSEQFRVPLARRAYRLSLSGPYGLSERSNTTGPSQGNLTVDDYRRSGVEVIVSESFTASIPRLDPEEDARRIAFYQDLAEKGELLMEFSPYKQGAVPPPYHFDQVYGPTLALDRYAFTGPVVRVYRLPPLPPPPAAPPTR